MTKPAKKTYEITVTLTYTNFVDARSAEEAERLAMEMVAREFADVAWATVVGVQDVQVEECEDVSEEYGDLDKESQEQADVENELPDFHPDLPVLELTESGIRTLDDIEESVALGEVLTSGLQDIEETHAALSARLLN